jgi:hypothetical protein
VLLTPEQLKEIRQIVEAYHGAFIVNTIGADVVSADLLARLQRMGLINLTVDSVREAYLYGQLVASGEHPRAAEMSYQEFKAWLRKHPIPLTSVEQDAVAFARQRAGEYCQGLGNRVAVDTGELAIEADADLRRQMRDTIQSATERNIAERDTIRKLKSNLGWATQDWARDWGRIASTETHFAMQHGVTEYIAKRHGSEARVAVRVMPDACDHCRRLFTGGDGQPIIFELADLEANGTNVGRKARDWLPVVPPVHPWCQCELTRVPDGWGFNAEGEMVPGGELGEAYGKSMAPWVALRREDLAKAAQRGGTVRYQGIEVAIENPVGSIRRWRDAGGVSGETLMRHAYGYAARSTGDDGDGVDVFLGPDPEASLAYVVHQRNPYTGVYDEAKVMLGFGSEGAAVAAYKAHYDNPEAFFGGVSQVAVDQLRRWLEGTEIPEVPAALRLQGDPQLIVPLTKATFAGSDGVASALLGPVLETVGNRSPGQGTSGNYHAGALGRRSVTADDVGFRPTPEELLDEVRADEDDRMTWRRDKGVYEIPEPVRHDIKLVLPVRPAGSGLGLAEKNHAHILDMQARVRAPTKNVVDVLASGRIDADGEEEP